MARVPICLPISSVKSYPISFLTQRKGSLALPSQLQESLSANPSFPNKHVMKPVHYLSTFGPKEPLPLVIWCPLPQSWANYNGWASFQLPLPHKLPLCYQDNCNKRCDLGLSLPLIIPRLSEHPLWITHRHTLRDSFLEGGEWGILWQEG